MFKRGRSYIYRGFTINYNKKNGQYFINMTNEAGESHRIYASTVMKLISILDAEY